LRDTKGTFLKVNEGIPTKLMQNTHIW